MVIGDEGSGTVLEPLDASVAPKLSADAALANARDGSIRAHLDNGGAVDVFLGSARAGLIPYGETQPPEFVIYDFVLRGSTCLDPPPERCDWHVFIDADTGEAIVSTGVVSS